jgi:hypothetical protein
MEFKMLFSKFSAVNTDIIRKMETPKKTKYFLIQKNAIGVKTYVSREIREKVKSDSIVSQLDFDTKSIKV